MDELTDLTQCPVCFEEYELDGHQSPRILPCSHTLCEKCLEVLIRNNKVDCPECRVKHQAAAGKRSFPQNKYIIAHIKAQTKEETGHPVQLPEKEPTTHALATREAPEVPSADSNPRSNQISLSLSVQRFSGKFCRLLEQHLLHLATAIHSSALRLILHCNVWRIILYGESRGSRTV